MKQWTKRMLAVALAVLMVIAALPVTAVTETADQAGVKAEEAVEKKAAEKKTTKYYALLVGNWDYQNINKLVGPKFDIKAMKAMLKGTRQNWQITMVKNATDKKMRSSIRKAFKDATKNDVCLFYYSGHGVSSENEKDEDYGALCGVGADIDYVNSTYTGVLRGGSLAYELNAATPGKVIVLLDACGSGSLIYKETGAKKALMEKASQANTFVDSMISSFTYFDNQAQALMEKTGELRQNKFYVLAACAHQDYSTELYNLDGSYGVGLFTEALCYSMGCDHETAAYTKKKMPADKNKDGKLTMKELTSGIRSRIKYWKQYFLEQGWGELTQAIKTYGNTSQVFFIRK